MAQFNFSQTTGGMSGYQQQQISNELHPSPQTARPLGGPASSSQLNLQQQSMDSQSIMLQQQQQSNVMYDWLSNMAAPQNQNDTSAQHFAAMPMGPLAAPEIRPG